MSPPPLNLKTTPQSSAPDKSSRPKNPWRILVVDDEKDVHAATRLIFTRLTFKNRPVELLGAYSAAEAKHILKTEKDIAIVLLDVDMETDDAGLRLLKYIRQELGNASVRIILRTGQPGHAPKEQVIIDYDINDYKTKEELTAKKLFTSIIAALRSYETLVTLNKTRVGLEKILHSSDSLLQMHSVRELASGILIQLGSFLGCNPEGIICIEEPLDNDTSGFNACSPMKIVASMGEYNNCLNCKLEDSCQHQNIAVHIKRALQERKSFFDDKYTVLYLETSEHKATVALVNSGHEVDENDQYLLAVFASKISLALENVIHYQKMISFEEAATTDFLTGLNNRRQLLRLGIPLFAGAKRNKMPLAVAMLDIDFFKQINDRYGHDIGDVVLKKIGGLLKNRFRQSDIVARYGGEEFCIIAPLKDASLAYGLFDNFRISVAEQRFDLPACALFITVSIGVSTYLRDTLDDMITDADNLMYCAKKEGRNCVKVSA